MMSCNLIPTWHKWNVNANDVMMTWLASYVSLVTSCLACATHVHVHDTCALNKYGASKYLSGLACIQAESNLENNNFTFLGNKYPKCK